VAREVIGALFAPETGLLLPCAVVLATADPWWLCLLARGPQPSAARVRVALLRGGCLAALGTPAELCGRADIPELEAALQSPHGMGAGATAFGDNGAAVTPLEVPLENPQDAPDDVRPPEEGAVLSTPQASHALAPKKVSETDTQTMLTEEQQQVVGVVQKEGRQEGGVRWKTYSSYFAAVGFAILFALALALIGIMVFQNFCNLWITYWTADNKSDTFMHTWIKRISGRQPPEQSNQLLLVYACLVAAFTLSNFLGHAFEIVGGVGAARLIFTEALTGTLARPFRWWDANPTGRVLNRMNTDVDTMDKAVTNIMGVIFGAVLYFIGHALMLAVTNPITLAILPFVALFMEYYAGYYRRVIREIQRMFLVCMSSVYQDMVEVIEGKVTVRAYASSRRFVCQSLDALEQLQCIYFTNKAVQYWIGLRLGLIGYSLTIFSRLYPVFQYYGVMTAKSAAFVGFAIQYSHEMVNIIQQLVMNWSDLEMQLISIERLREYTPTEEATDRRLQLPAPPAGAVRGLCLTGVEVTYKAGLPPALTGVSLAFRPREVAAIMGRTGAGKSSLLLSVLQLVPYQGRIEVDGLVLATLDPEEVRRRLVGVVPQQPVLFEGDLRWNLDPEGDHQEQELFGALEAVGLRSLASSCRGGAAEAVAALQGLSQGQRQLVCAARVLLRRPRVVLLDEVTASLPPELASSTASALMHRFKEHDATVLLVTHQEELLACCERVISVDAGRVVGDRDVRP